MPGPPDGRCPRCRTTEIHRAKVTSAIARLRKRLSGKRFYRCADCRWTGWLHPLEVPDRSMNVKQSLNLRDVDRALGGGDDPPHAKPRSRRR